MKLDVKSFALTAGIFWGLALLIITWWIILFEGQTGETTIIGLVYRGYNISFTGSLIGFAWGLFDGLVIGALFAFVYNALAAQRSLKREDS